MPYTSKGPSKWLDKENNQWFADKRGNASLLLEGVHGAKEALCFYDSWDAFYEFTNFYKGQPIKIDGLNWPTAEHYFQAQKFTDPKAQEFIRTKIFHSREAFECSRGKNKVFAEALARKEFNDMQFSPDEWHNSRKHEVMKRAVGEKFKQDKELQRLLLSTGNTVLIENAGSNDKDWGNGEDGLGSNLLGKILMEVRNELRLELEKKAHAANKEYSPSYNQVKHSLSSIPGKKIPELAKQAFGTKFYPMAYQGKSVVKLYFSSENQRNMALQQLRSFQVRNVRSEHILDAPKNAKNGYEHPYALSFKIPQTLLKQGITPEFYLKQLLTIAKREQELLKQSENDLDQDTHDNLWEEIAQLEKQMERITTENTAAAVPCVSSAGFFAPSSMERPILDHSILILAQKVFSMQSPPTGYIDGNMIKMRFKDIGNAWINSESIGKKGETRSITIDNGMLCFTVPEKLKLSPALYIQILLEVGARMKELQSEIKGCWTITGEKQIKQAKINGLNAILTEMTDTQTTLSFDAIINEVRNAPKYRLDEKRSGSFLSCVLGKNSRTTETLDGCVAKCSR